MKKLILIIISCVAIDNLYAQSYSLHELEAHFLQHNGLLIANKYNISKSDAEIIQAKVWQNPNFSISELNLWKNGTAEQLSPLLGKYGKHQQISFELEQVIETANKRKKRVSMKQLERNSTLLDYEELIRELKKELRYTYYSLARIHKEQVQLQYMLDLFRLMNEQYERQSNLNNVRKADFYRVQTEMLSLKKEQIDLENDKIEALAKLRILSNIFTLELSQIVFESNDINLTKRLPYDILLEAKNQNIGLLRQQNQIKIAKQQLEMEKAERMPNIALKLGYDRGGNIMRDFVGVGAGMDIPIFNKNKGNIKVATYEIQQQQSSQVALQYELEQGVKQLEDQLRRVEVSLIDWPNNEMAEQEKMIVNYQKHLQNKEVTLIEFIDFVKSYRDVTQAYCQLIETYYKTFEELQYLIGKDL